MHRATVPYGFTVYPRVNTPLLVVVLHPLQSVGSWICASRKSDSLTVPGCAAGVDVLHANQAPLPVIWRHSRSSAFPRALDAVTECSQSTHPTHRWVRKPGSPFEEHFGQQAPVAQLTDRRPQVSLSVIARLLVPEQLSRHVLQGGPVGPSQQALQRVRSRL